MPFSISIDTGGTFTDLVLADEQTIRGLHKAPTTPDEPFDGIRAALEEAARAEGRDVASLLADTATIVYATTHATNAILEGRTARTAFLTTEGHRDILLYREGGKQEPFNLARPYPAPLVPRSLCFELPERVLADGSIARPLDEDAVGAVIERLRARGRGGGRLPALVDRESGARAPCRRAARPPPPGHPPYALPPRQSEAPRVPPRLVDGARRVARR